MKATDLRLGNNVYYRVHDDLDNPKFYDVIDTIDVHDLRVIDENDHGYSPIPLTSEILERLGFEKDSKYDWVMVEKNFQIVVYYDPDWETLDNGKGSFMFTGGYCLNFEHVHELQNLYYALTGQELTFKTIEDEN